MEGILDHQAEFNPRLCCIYKLIPIFQCMYVKSYREEELDYISDKLFICVQVLPK